MNLNTNSNSNNTFSNSSTTTIIEGTTEYTGVGYDNISINDNNGSGSAGGFFIRNDSFGSNNSETMMLPMNLGDNGMDDSAFALEDHHTMNPASFMDQQAVPCIPLTAATSTAAGTGGRTIDPMMLHTGVPTVVPPSSVDTKPSGIPPIISAEEMLAKTNANASATTTTTTTTTTNEHNTVGTTVQHSVSQLVLQQPQPQPQQPQQPQQQQQQQQLQTLQQITVYTGGDKLAKPEPRKKLWKCTFPGCTEPPKTHYNCYSHVWDSHIRHSLPQDNPLGAVVYKKIADKVQVKELCKQYMIELDDTNRKRRRNKKGPGEQNVGQQQQLLDNGVSTLFNSGYGIATSSVGSAATTTVLNATTTTEGVAYVQGVNIGNTDMEHNTVSGATAATATTAMATDENTGAQHKVEAGFVETSTFVDDSGWTQPQPHDQQIDMGPPQKRLHAENTEYAYGIYNNDTTNVAQCADASATNGQVKTETTSDDNVSPMDCVATGGSVMERPFVGYSIQQQQQQQQQQQHFQQLQQSYENEGNAMNNNNNSNNSSNNEINNAQVMEPGNAFQFMHLSGNGIPEVTPLATTVPQQQQHQLFITPTQTSGSSDPSSSASPVAASGGDTPASPGKAVVVVPAPSGDDVTTGVDHSYSLDQDGVTKIIINSSGLARLYVCGEVFAEHGFLQRSDARFKEQIMPIGGALNKVLQITGKTFRYKGDSSGTTRMGFIAQELEEVVPTAVYRDEHGLSVDVVSLVPLILEALKEMYHNTLAVEGEQAHKLNEAVKYAMDKVEELDKKFEALRNSDSSDDEDDGSDNEDDTCSSSSNSVTISPIGDDTKKHAHNKHNGKQRHHRHHSHHSSNKNKGKKGKSKRKQSKGKSRHNDGNNNNNNSIGTYGEGENNGYEMGVRTKDTGDSSTDDDDDDDGDNTGHPFNYIFQNDKKESGHFRYKFSFGPPLVVLISTVLFFAAGIFALNFVRKMPFVWIYCFFAGAVLVVSLIYQRDELIATFRNLEIKLYWNPENTLNSYFLAVTAMIGLVLTMILGLSSVICVAILFFVLIATWMFSVIAHNKYNVRIQSIFVLCSGILVFMGCCFGFTYMAQPFKCEFDEYSGSWIEVPVYVGKEISHIQIKSVPWNCFFSQVEVSSPLPGMIRLNTESAHPFFEGYVNNTFDSVPTQVKLHCSQHQSFTCGTLVFQPCLSYSDELKCKSNGCSWCAGYGPNKTGACGFCSQDFSAQCIESTGVYPSCVADVITSSSFTLKPMKALLAVLSSLL